uniref:Pleckstrin homology domain containing S1, tandem duplicate 2 n=1 Tax=Electrophorus electricus TaxID=8005 RepID=A0A4W4EJT1_ELEEL
MEEIRSGYLYKSPPPYMSKSLKSWKRRYFVLGKAGGNIYKLKYFKDENKREKQQGEIKLYEYAISLLFLCPKTHPSWEWIHRNFKCTPSCVLYLKVPDRDYFLIGENRLVMLFENSFHDNSKFFPCFVLRKCYNRSTQNSQKSEDEDDEEDEQKEREELDKEEIGEETNSSNYMSMEKVYERFLASLHVLLSTVYVTNIYIFCITHKSYKCSLIAFLLPCQPSLLGSVSDCRLIQFSNIFHKGDQILAINDLLTYNLGEVQNYLKRINKDQVRMHDFPPVCFM